MNKETIMNDLTELSGSHYFCTRKQLMNYLSISPNTFKTYFEDAASVHGKYYIPDIADQILNMSGGTDLEQKKDV